MVRSIGTDQLMVLVQRLARAQHVASSPVAAGGPANGRAIRAVLDETTVVVQAQPVYRWRCFCRAVATVLFALNVPLQQDIGVRKWEKGGPAIGRARVS
jgi:hypothetical protein